jgi:hypothetical protein
VRFFCTTTSMLQHESERYAHQRIFQRPIERIGIFQQALARFAEFIQSIFQGSDCKGDKRPRFQRMLFGVSPHALDHPWRKRQEYWRDLGFRMHFVERLQYRPVQIILLGQVLSSFRGAMGQETILNFIRSPRLIPEFLAQVIWTWRLSSMYPPGG